MTIKLELGSLFLRHWFELRPENYIWFSSTTSECWISLSEETDTVDQWILGDPFLMGYFTILDYDTMKIGLVGPGDTSVKTVALSNMSYKT
jgi:hypothetical protein